MKTSMKGMAEECFSCNSRASCRSEMYGEMKAVTEMVEESAKRSETSPIRRMFSTREAWSKPRSLITEMCLSASHPSSSFRGGDTPC